MFYLSFPHFCHLLALHRGENYDFNHEYAESLYSDYQRFNMKDCKNVEDVKQYLRDYA